MRDVDAFIDALRILVYEPNADQAYMAVIQRGSSEDIEEDSEEQQQRDPSTPPRGRVVTVRFVLPTLVDVSGRSNVNNFPPLLLPFTKNTEEQFRVIMRFEGEDPNQFNISYGGILRVAWRLMVDEATRTQQTPDMTRFHIFPLRDTVAATPALPMHLQLGAGAAPSPPARPLPSSSRPGRKRTTTEDASGPSTSQDTQYQDLARLVQRVYHPHPSEFQTLAKEYARDKRFINKAQPPDRLTEDYAVIQKDASPEALAFYNKHLSHLVQPINFHRLSSTMAYYLEDDGGLFEKPSVESEHRGAFRCSYDIWTHRRFAAYFAITLYVFLRRYEEKLSAEQIHALDMSMTKVLAQQEVPNFAAVTAPVMLLDNYTHCLEDLHNLIEQGLRVFLSQTVILDAFLDNAYTHTVTLTHRAHTRDVSHITNKRRHVLTFYSDIIHSAHIPLPPAVVDFLNALPRRHTLLWFKFATFWSQSKKLEIIHLHFNFFSFFRSPPSTCVIAKYLIHGSLFLE